jgi:hypothetical protein
MLTPTAVRSLPETLDSAYDTVVTVAELGGWGWSPAAIRGQLDARRWQRAGRAIVLHNGPLQPDEQRRVALLACGPRALLTAFSAAEEHGLRGWERDRIHLLVPAGTRVRRQRVCAVRVHYTGDWAAAAKIPARRLHQRVARPAGRGARRGTPAAASCRLAGRGSLTSTSAARRSARSTSRDCADGSGYPSRRIKRCAPSGTAGAATATQNGLAPRSARRSRSRRRAASNPAPLVGRPIPAERTDDQRHARAALPERGHTNRPGYGRRPTSSRPATVTQPAATLCPFRR